MGLVRREAFHVEQSRWLKRREARAALEAEKLNPDRATRERVLSACGVELNAPATWAQVLRRQDVDLDRARRNVPELATLSSEDCRVVVGTLRYDGYLDRHRREIERVHRLREVEIPRDLDPKTIPGLSREVVEQLEHHRPATLADAERLPGMTPAATAILAGRLSKSRGRS